MMDTLKMDIDALLGERWFPKETSFEEDITEYWGEWGVCSEVETLRAVLSVAPGRKLKALIQKQFVFQTSRSTLSLCADNTIMWLRPIRTLAQRFTM